MPAEERWREIGFATIEAARPLGLLQTTENAISFVACRDVTVVEQGELILRTVSASQFHKVFPAWRRLASMISSADLVELWTIEPEDVITMGLQGRAPIEDADELTKGLKACGLDWSNVRDRDPSFEKALRLAEQA